MVLPQIYLLNIPQSSAEWLFWLVCGLLVILGFFLVPYFQEKKPGGTSNTTSKTIDLIFTKLDKNSDHLMEIKEDIAEVGMKAEVTATHVEHIRIGIADLKKQFTDISHHVNRIENEHRKNHGI